MSKRFRQSVGIESAPLQDELILFHSQTNKFCVLNCTSSFIWSQLQRPVSDEEIAQQLGQRFGGVTASDALRDVDLALKEMLDLGLIVDVGAG